MGGETGPGVSARGCQAGEDQAEPRVSETRDQGTAPWGATSAQKRPFPRRSLLLTGQQASRVAPLVPSRDRQLPGPSDPGPRDPLLPDKPGPDPLPFPLPLPRPPPPPAPALSPLAS